jgi:hypothetical protein
LTAASGENVIADPPSTRTRPLAIVAAVLFVVSSVFPAVAGLTRDTSSFSPWWGVMDVTLAAVLAAVAFAVVGTAGSRVDRLAIDRSYRAYRVLIHGIMAMLVLFFLFGDRIVWTNCLTGFAWRTWLLLYCLPAWFASLGPSLAEHGSAGLRG